MGADIHSFAEVRTTGKWVRVTEPLFEDYDDKKTTEPFAWRSYAVFGFLADVRNYSCCKPICEPKGLPDDSEYINRISPYGYGGTFKEALQEDYNCHSFSWLTLNELLDFDYEQTFCDRRVSKQVSPRGWNNAALAEEGEGQIVTYREHLGNGFFKDIEVLKTLGSSEDVRIVFWFDN